MRGTEPADIQNKMKHTYKNRCFLRRKRESSAAPVPIPIPTPRQG